MLDALSEKFEKILKKLRGHGVLTEDNIAEALKRSLNTSYYRLMLELRNGPQDVEVTTKIGLRNVLDEEPAVASVELRRRRLHLSLT